MSIARNDDLCSVDSIILDDIVGMIKGTTDFMEAVREADLIIEAIPEDMDLKMQMFKQLDEACPEQTVLATNTSSLSITTIATATKRRDKVIGMHFSNPVPVMVGVELIKGLKTSDETVEVTKEVCRRMGKESFTSQDFPGFISNRMFPLFVNEAFYVVWQGIATPNDVDKAVKTQLRHPMGPLEVADFVGLDTYAIHSRISTEGSGR